MTYPLEPPAPDLHTVDAQPTGVHRVTLQFRLRLWWRSLVARLAGPARLLPGIAAAGCAFAGSFLLWGLGVALLVAAGALLLVDARTPRA